MNFPVTLATDYECFPPLGFHGGFPCGIAQFIEVANDVHLYQFGPNSTTEFADSGIQAFLNSRESGQMASLKFRPERLQSRRSILYSVSSPGR